MQLTKRLCNAAATHGHLACLQLLRERNCPCGIECTRLAASHGHVDCMKFLLAAANGHERRCEIRGGKAVHEAAKARHAGCLQVLRQDDASINDANFLKEIKESDDSYLRLLIDAGFSIPVGAVRTAIEDKNLARLEYICSSQCCELDVQLANTAAEMSQGKDYLEVLHKYDCPWDEYTSVSAASQPEIDPLGCPHHGAGHRVRPRRVFEVRLGARLSLP